VVNKRIIWKDAEGDDKRASFQSRAIRELGGANVGREWLCGGSVDTRDPVSTSCGLGEGATRVRGSTTPRASANSLNLCAARRRGARQIEVDDSDFTQDHREYLQEWADKLGVSVGVLVGRIVIATCKGDLYLEDAPEDRPCTP